MHGDTVHVITILLTINYRVKELLGVSLGIARVLTTVLILVAFLIGEYLETIS